MALNKMSAEGSKNDDGICIGDFICLYAEETKGYVYSNLSSSVLNKIAVEEDEDLKNPAALNPTYIMFEICMPNRYKSTKKLKKLKEKLQDDPKNEQALKELGQAEKSAEIEHTANAAEQERQKGKSVTYGQVVQLKHVFTGKYLHVNTTETSRTETSHLSTEIHKHSGKTAQFKMIPRYKVKSEGDALRAGDLVTLESIKTAGQYLHVSKRKLDAQSMYGDKFELNLSVEPSGFTVYKASSADTAKYTHLPVRGCTIVRFFHKEREGLLCAEGVFGQPIVENVHMRIRPITSANPKSINPPNQAINFWTIHKEDCAYDGNMILWEEHVRVQHATTLQFLSMSPNGDVTLTSDRVDPSTVFKLFPVVKRTDYLTNKAFARFQNVITGLWLADGQEAYTRLERTISDPTATTALKDIHYSRAPLRKLRGTPDMMYDDAFSVEIVSPEIAFETNFVAGFVPFMQRLVQEIIKETNHCMVKNGEPNKQLQKLMRNFQLVDRVVEVLRCTIPTTATKDFIEKLHTQCYEWLQRYLDGVSHKNEMYIARHLEFFDKQLAIPGPIGFAATTMLMDLLHDNLFLIDFLNQQNISTYVSFIKRKKRGRYLQLMKVICICNGIAVEDKQTMVAKCWLEQSVEVNDNVLNYFCVGEEICETPGVVFISTDVKETWMELDRFCRENKKDSPEYKFLEMQLEMFSVLCKGRNQYAIEVITEKLKLMSMHLALCALSDNRLPGSLRAKFFGIISDMFFDVPGNYSSNDREQLIFPYNDIQQAEEASRNNRARRLKTAAEQRSDLSVAIPKVDIPKLPELKQWIRGFLEENGVMVAADTQRNTMLRGLAMLIYNLIDYGYADTSGMLTLIMRIIDGQTDIPFKQESKPGVNYAEAVKKFRDSGRFEKNAENTILVDAKIQLLRVVEMFFNLRFNIRIVRFISEFKFTYHNREKAPLAPFLSEKADPQAFRNDPSLHSIACFQMMKMFDETQFFTTDFVVVMKDLLRYHYTALTTPSLALLNNYYGAYDNLFRNCARAKLALTTKSNAVLQEVSSLVPQFKILKSTKLTQRNITEILEILQKFSKFCCIETDSRENHVFNQEILYNHGVLDDVFDILTRTQEQSDTQNGEVANVLRHCLRLLRLMSRNHTTSQGRIFTRLDELLKIRNAQAELGEMIVEIFSNHLGNCLKLQPSHIEAIVLQYSESLHPVWLTLLTSLAVVNIYPIRRNQSLIVKALMNYSAIVAILTNTPTAKKTEILRLEEDNEEFDQKHRFCSLVNLFATCAAGGNHSVESICQCLLTIEELLTFINMSELCPGLKGPFVCYLVYAYLNSNMNSAHEVLRKYTMEKGETRFVKFVKSLVEAMNEASAILTQNVPMAIEYFKHRPKNIHRHRLDQEHERKEVLAYVCDAGVPFLQAVFKESHWERTVKLDKGTIDSIIIALTTFAKACIPCLDRPNKRIEIVNLLRQISVCTKRSFPVPSELAKPPVAIVSGSRAQYKSYYADEEEMNELFDQFTTRIRRAIEYRNTVRDQIGFPSEKPYTVLQSDDSLPLGEEFQTFLKSFANQNTGKEVVSVGGIIRHLTKSWDTKRKSEAERVTLARLDRKLIQILRALVWNQCVKLPETRQENPKLYKEVLADTAAMQVALGEQGVIGAVLPHLSVSSGETVKEVLNLLNIFFKDNAKGPQYFVKYVTEKNHEAFFIVVQQHLRRVESIVKEQRVLIAEHGRFEEETKRLYEKQQHFARVGKKDMGLLKNINTILADKDDLTPEEVTMQKHMEELTWRFKRRLKDAPVIITSASEERKDDQELVLPKAPELDVIKTTNFANILFSMIQSLCDMKYEEAQELMREQPNARAVNLVADVCHLFSILYVSIDSPLIKMNTNALNALCEMIRGNVLNQGVVFDNKTIDFLNVVMSENRSPAKAFSRSKHSDVTDFLTTLGYFLTFLTEENRANDVDGLGGAGFMGKVSKDGLWAMAKLCYSRYHEPKKDVTSTDREAYLAAGFLFYCLIRRSIDLEAVTDQKERSFNETLHAKDDAWIYYAERSVSVELVKNNILQRFHFRVADLTKAGLRVDVQEKLTWGIDRSNPGKKIRDFMGYVKDIGYDIYFQRKIIKRPVGRFFVSQWKSFNYLLMTFSLGIQLALLSFWTIGAKDTPPIAYPSPDEQTTKNIQWFCGIPHNVICAALFISFCLSNLGGFASWLDVVFARIRLTFYNVTGKDVKVKVPRMSNLAVGLLSGTVVYYVAYVAFSLLGTFVTPAFFSFHVLQIAQNNQLLNRVLQSVTYNGSSLIWVTIMGMILIYIFALVAFLLFREILNEGYLFCNTLYQCTLTLLREGLIYRIMRIDYPTSKTTQFFSTYAAKLVWDILFFIVILTIGLNVIFGVIVDTFRQLRDAKFAIDQDMASRCFICSRNGFEFEQKGISFNSHLENEHNQIAYIYFFVKMEDTENSQFTALEMYVRDMVKNENYTFFPTNRAISLDGIETKDKAAEDDIALFQRLNDVLHKLNEEQLVFAEQAALEKRKEWTQKYLTSRPLLVRSASAAETSKIRADSESSSWSAPVGLQFVAKSRLRQPDEMTRSSDDMFIPEFEGEEFLDPKAASSVQQKQQFGRRETRSDAGYASRRDGRQPRP